MKKIDTWDFMDELAGPDVVPITIRFPKEVHDQLQEVYVNRGVSKQKLVVAIVRTWMRENGGKLVMKK